MSPIFGFFSGLISKLLFDPFSFRGKYLRSDSKSLLGSRPRHAGGSRSEGRASRQHGCYRFVAEQQTVLWQCRRQSGHHLSRWSRQTSVLWSQAIVWKRTTANCFRRRLGWLESSQWWVFTLTPLGCCVHTNGRNWYLNLRCITISFDRFISP